MEEVINLLRIWATDLRHTLTKLHPHLWKAKNVKRETNFTPWLTHHKPRSLFFTGESRLTTICSIPPETQITVEMSGHAARMRGFTNEQKLIWKSEETRPIKEMGM